MRVVIADDSVLLREGLARVLADGGFEVVAQAANADELRQAVRRYKPDVAIVDVRMPPTHTDEGARAAVEIREEQPEVAVLVLSQVIEAAHAVRLFSERPEGFGYLLKDRVLEIDDFLEAVRRVGKGGTAIDPEVIGQLVGRRHGRRPARGAHPARARGARADGAGALEPRHLREARREPEDRRDPRQLDLPEARAHAGAGRASPRARGARVPALVAALRAPGGLAPGRPERVHGGQVAARLANQRLPRRSGCPSSCDECPIPRSRSAQPNQPSSRSPLSGAARARSDGGYAASMREFHASDLYAPTGDQPRAIEEIAASVAAGNRFQTILGATGTGKTATMAWTIEKLQRPALVIAHNKTLAAQLCNEFREFFPENAVEYFVSYYDYYQPEAYVPQADLYIEKDSSQNDDIARLRLSATSSLMTRRDVVVVASVSCIYGLGSPEEWRERVLILEVGEEHDRDGCSRS